MSYAPRVASAPPSECPVTSCNRSCVIQQSMCHATGYVSHCRWTGAQVWGICHAPTLAPIIVQGQREVWIRAENEAVQLGPPRHSINSSRHCRPLTQQSTPCQCMRSVGIKPWTLSYDSRALDQRCDVPVTRTVNSSGGTVAAFATSVTLARTASRRPLECQEARKPACTIGQVPSHHCPRFGGCVVRHACALLRIEKDAEPYKYITLSHSKCG